MTAGSSPSALSSRRLAFLAFAANILCLWTIFAWYQRVYQELQITRQESSAAVSSSQACESEQKAQIEEIQRLRAKYGDEMMDAQATIDRLNTTSRAVGYANYPGGQLIEAEDVVVVIKTGATEAFKTLPIHLSTTLTHVPNHLLFSDHEAKMGQYYIQDALDECSPESIKLNDDFQLYRDQKQYLLLGQNPEYLELKGGWDLDKYKNIHMLSKTFKQRPDANWYLFIDADSYVVMANLLPYMRGLDPNKKLYIGSAAYIGDYAFGHGGTGYLLSHAAMKAVMEKDPDMGRKYEQVAKDSCCGDYVLAKMLKDEMGIELSWSMPHFQGEPPSKIGMNKGKLCQPIVTLHHMRPEEVASMWEFEREMAKPGKYILFRDVFEHFVYPYLQDMLTEWDNMCDDQGEEVKLPEDEVQETQNGTPIPKEEMSKEEKGAGVFGKCRKACEDRKDCVQFRTWREECKISTNSVMLGWKVPVTRDDHEEYRSGWIMERVEEMRKVPPCEQPGATWPKDALRGG
ncbi:MAG: hypothetical protein Q9217_005062 [Psora testacea]